MAEPSEAHLVWERREVRSHVTATRSTRNVTYQDVTLVISRATMPPKRKAPAEPLPSEPSRRKLRSDGPVTPAKPPPKPRTAARATQRPAANGRPGHKVQPEPPKKPDARTTRSKAAAGSSKTEKAPPKRATKKTKVVTAEVDPEPEVETIEAPRRQGRPPGVRPRVIEVEAIQAKPSSKILPTKPSKPPPRSSTKTSTRTTTARGGSSKSSIKPSRSRTTKKNVPGVAEEERGERENDEESVTEPVPPRPTTPVRPKVIMDAVEIVTPNVSRHSFSSNRNTPPHQRPSPTKSPSILPAVISVEPTRPSRPRVPPPASLRKRRRNERSPSLEPPRLPSPSKRAMRPGAFTASATTKFPAHYHTCLRAQKRAIMAALRNPPEIETEGDRDESPSANELAYSDLCDLLAGSIVRGEGNSCLLIGPRGSGKTRVR